MHFARAATGILRATNMSCCIVARHSETLEPMVVYRALYGERGVWVRPAAMWSEPVERDGYHGPRFQWIGGASEGV